MDADSLAREFEERLASELSEIPDDTTRFLTFLAWLNERLEESGVGRVILVGGFAVEVYTGSAYRTLDIDIVVEGPRGAELVRDFLERVAERAGRTMVPKLAPLASRGIDLVGTIHTGKKKPVTLRIGGRRLHVEAPEDLIVKSLAAWRYWRSQEDREKSILLLRTWSGRLDIQYLRSRAEEEGLSDLLEEALREAGQ